MEQKQYLAIDLKSFYASVECVERGLDPLRTHLVVADRTRTDKTICLAVSPSLKACGIPGRPRLFEVVQRVREVNAQRKKCLPTYAFAGSSYLTQELEANPELELSYIVASPRMAFYIDYSTRIYQIYLRYVAPEDIHVYSIDEVFIDVTQYLKTYRMTARELAMRMIRDVLASTGITATAGIGSNLYLCKVAMDIVAKHIPADADGVRIAELDELSYRQLLWEHRPLTDFWRVGKGYAKKLEANGMFTMGDVALCSLQNEDLLYRLFGVNAELLIDHAWGWEPCTVAEIKAYKPDSNSIGSAQVLQRPYTCAQARLVAREMADQLALDLLEKGLETDRVVLSVGYDVESLSEPSVSRRYRGGVTEDHYGRIVPKPVHGNGDLPRRSASAELIAEAVMAVFDRIVDPILLVRRIGLTASRVLPERSASPEPSGVQLDFFTDYEAQERERKAREEALQKEKQKQTAVLKIRRKYGKNAIVKGMDLEDGATAMERNRQIGGHKA